MIEVRGLRVDYDEVCGVRDLTFSVGPGEIYALIGPNGAGKTTALRALAGILEPALGEVRIAGFDLFSERKQALQRVGFMPDFSPLYEDLTVCEYLDVWAASYLVPSSERKAVISRRLDQVGLADRSESMCGELSLGMKRRLTLAKTLLPDPEVLILDEPASGMDPHGRALLKRIVRDLGQADRTVIISSHILSELSEICTSVGIMAGGELRVSGRIEEVTALARGGQRYTMEVVSGQSLLDALLVEEVGVSDLRHTGATTSFIFRGNREAASELLARLLAAGVRVASFARPHEELEELFLCSTTP